jgi:hypothetical protein
MIIRVRAKTREDGHRQLNVSEDGLTVVCDCGGFASGLFCSHIDAVLLAGEREMVLEEDHGLADQAMVLTQERIVVPENWKASWRENMPWRGLSRSGARRQRACESGKPLVCFTGGKNRAGWTSDAQASGWDTIDSPSRFIDVLVAADPTAKSRKLVAARLNGTAIVTYEEWAVLITDGVLPSVSNRMESGGGALSADGG